MIPPNLRRRVTSSVSRFDHVRLRYGNPYGVSSAVWKSATGYDHPFQSGLPLGEQPNWQRARDAADPHLRMLALHVDRLGSRALPLAAVANAGCGAAHPPTPYSVIAV